MKLPQRKKFMLGLAKLSFFPNTPIENLLKEQKKKISDEKMFEFWNRMYLLTQSYLPKRVLLNISKNKYFRDNPKLLNMFFIFSPSSLFVGGLLSIRRVFPADIFNYIKSIKYNLIGK